MHIRVLVFFNLRSGICSGGDRRLQAREGERYTNFAARWIPLEEGYFAQYRIEETTDLAVDTTAANACAGMMCR